MRLISPRNRRDDLRTRNNKMANDMGRTRQ
jgi:hypothetical protein